MGLATRIIPVMLVRGDQLIKGKQFNAWRSVGHPLQAAKIHNARGVDELCMLDIAATPTGRGPNLKLVEKLAEVCYMPLSVGGGINSTDDVRDLLNAGADKVVIGTGAVEGTLVQECADKFGSQAITVSIDVWRDGDIYSPRIECGKTPIPISPCNYAATMEARGAGEILLTSIDREGTMSGYDLELIRAVSGVVGVPVIANGGCGSYDDMEAAIKAGAHAVAAGAFFQFTDVTPKKCAEYLSKKGVEVRL